MTLTIIQLGRVFYYTFRGSMPRGHPFGKESPNELRPCGGASAIYIIYVAIFFFHLISFIDLK